MKITHVEPIILRLPKVTEDVDGTQDDLLISPASESKSTQTWLPSIA